MTGMAMALMAAGPSAGAAQGSAILLQIKPRQGDTIRVRLDQTVEIAGVARTGDQQPSVMESGTLVMHATLAIEAVDRAGATVVSVTDSVRVNTPPNSASAAVLAWAAAAANRAVRFRIATDGSAAIPNARGGAPPVGMVGAQMPATLPRRPIEPGTSWTSTMRVPLASSVDPKGVATLTATFTFDSLSRSGELAFLSLRGRLIKGDDTPGGGKDGSQVETSGTVIGQVLIDRRRGWITDARTTFSLLSLVSPADRSKRPMRVRMTISQWMRAM
jgi:hypothetical protein